MDISRELQAGLNIDLTNNVTQVTLLTIDTILKGE
jgi:hypothetical protein